MFDWCIICMICTENVQIVTPTVARNTPIVKYVLLGWQTYLISSLICEQSQG